MPETARPTGSFYTDTRVQGAAKDFVVDAIQTRDPAKQAERNAAAARRNHIELAKIGFSDRLAAATTRQEVNAIMGQIVNAPGIGVNDFRRAIHDALERIKNAARPEFPAGVDIAGLPRPVVERLADEYGYYKWSPEDLAHNVQFEREILERARPVLDWFKNNDTSMIEDFEFFEYVQAHPDQFDVAQLEEEKQRWTPVGTPPKITAFSARLIEPLPWWAPGSRKVSQVLTVLFEDPAISHSDEVIGSANGLPVFAGGDFRDALGWQGMATPRLEDSCVEVQYQQPDGVWTTIAAGLDEGFTGVPVNVMCYNVPPGALWIRCRIINYRALPADDSRLYKGEWSDPLYLSVQHKLDDALRAWNVDTSKGDPRLPAAPFGTGAGEPQPDDNPPIRVQVGAPVDKGDGKLEVPFMAVAVSHTDGEPAEDPVEDGVQVLGVDEESVAPEPLVAEPVTKGSSLPPHHARGTDPVPAAVDEVPPPSSVTHPVAGPPKTELDLLRETVERQNRMIENLTRLLESLHAQATA